MEERAVGTTFMLYWTHSWWIRRYYSDIKVSLVTDHERTILAITKKHIDIDQSTTVCDADVIVIVVVHA
jgi:hypothetical protein